MHLFRFGYDHVNISGKEYPVHLLLVSLGFLYIVHVLSLGFLFIAGDC